MTLNDRLASRALSAKVGTLRAGVGIYNSFNTMFEEAQSTISNSGRAGVRTNKLAFELGDQLETMIDELSQRRLDTLTTYFSDTAGIELKRPNSPGSLRVERGSIGKEFDRVAKSASRFARGAPTDQALSRLQQYTKTVSRSAANAAHNAAVLAIARSNKTVVQGVVALATLDNRTSDICISRHGGAWDIITGEPLGWSSIQYEFPGRPPWHYNCRTTLSPVLIGEEPPTDQVMDIDQWFDSPDAAEALGEQKLMLFKTGVLSRSQLVDQSGRPIELGKL